MPGFVFTLQTRPAMHLAGIFKPAQCVGFFFSVRRYRERWRGGHVGKKKKTGVYSPAFGLF